MIIPEKRPEGKIVLIGGSAGSIPVLNKLLCSLPRTYKIPIVICVHRMKNVPGTIREVFSKNCKLDIIEPEDKQEIAEGEIYLAPSNYHLLIEKEMVFSLSTDIPVNYSRPSIDITFESACRVFTNNIVAILLTGANSDGAKGLALVKKHGGITIVQNPEECAAPYMPLSAIELNCVSHVLSLDEIIKYLKTLSLH